MNEITAMKRKTLFLILFTNIIFLSCNISGDKIKIGTVDLSNIDPGNYDATWWNRAPYRLVQTNLPEIEALMDVDAYVKSIL